MAEPFPWEKAMQFAFGHLRLSPKQFWSMTLHELNAAMCAHYGETSQAITRNALDRLIKQHPDI